MAKRARGWEVVPASRRKRPVRTGVASSPPGKKRLRIAKASKSRIRDIILDWKGPKFTWPLLMTAINREFAGDWRPQSIAKHADLQHYFQVTKDRIRKETADLAAGKRPKTVGATTEVLLDRIKHLQRENGDLKQALTENEARLNRWRKNALLNRVPISMLDAPLQPNDRGRSDR